MRKIQYAYGKSKYLLNIQSCFVGANLAGTEFCELAFD